MANDIVSKDYSEYIKLSENKEKPVRIPFSNEEIKSLFEVEPTLPYVDTILTMIYSGIRPGELINIKPEDVNIAEQYFIVTESKTEAGQNRLVPINTKILPFLKRRLEAGTEYLIMHPSKEQADGL